MQAAINMQAVSREAMSVAARNTAVASRRSSPAPARRTAAAACRPFAVASCHRQAARRLRICSSAAEAGSNGSAIATTTSISIPTRLNTIPHERSTRQWFYKDGVEGIRKAVAAGEIRVAARCTIPELNTEFDVYRAGTLLEWVRDIATALAGDGLTVKVCVQQALGEGVFQGMPMSLNGIMRIMGQMDWGTVKDRVVLGNLGGKEVEGADVFVCIAPQNIVGHSVLPLLAEMSEAATASGKTIVLINPKLGDIQSAGGVMSVRGRQGRMDFTSTYIPAYHFRLLYKGPMMFPIMGALRHQYGGPWEVHRRVQLGPGQEEYQLIAEFEAEPNASQITKAFQAAWAKANTLI